MTSPRRKKILFYILRNLAIYMVLMGITYLTSRISNSHRKVAEPMNLSTHLIITTFYIWAMIHNSLLFEKFFLKKKYVLYVLSFISGLTLIIFTHRKIAMAYGASGEGIMSNIFGNFFYICIALAFYLAFKYLSERKTFFQLKVMQRDIELQQLREHLNPHFLFNALNNIYSYTLQHNRFGDELILKLSELMRFILDCSDKEKISVKDELGFISNYIVFEKERLGERCTIHYKLDGDYSGRLIAPLILFPFIENACKYGADTIQRTEIDISIENLPRTLKLKVRNSIANANPPSAKTGLQKAIRRLELLYPDKHEVLIITDDYTFSVELILKYDED